MSGELKIGAPVVVKVNPRQNNGSDEAAGIVVRPLNVEGDQRANIKVFLDGDENLTLRNVQVLDSAPDKDDEDAPKQYALRA